MATINLLPWREEYRQEKKREFISVLVGVLVIAALIVFLWDRAISTAIDNQNARNQLLRSEIAILDKQVQEINELKRQRDEMKERMRVIQELQGNRPVIVRIFDEMVRVIPDGLFVTSMKRNGNVIAIEGVAESNNRVSSLMRQLDASDWFADPNLTMVKANPMLSEQGSEFNLTVKVSTPKRDDEGA